MRRRSTTIWASTSLPDGWSKIWRSVPTVMVTLPPWTVTVPIAPSSDVTACHSMLWLTGCSKIWRSVFRWWLSRCGDSGEDDIVLPSDTSLRGGAEGSLVARVFITGSSDGLGLMAARLLADQGHAVVLHARNPSRAGDA